jgi:hypothetical protein
VVFSKNQDGDWSKNIDFSSRLGFLGVIFHKICIFTSIFTTQKCKNKIEKILEILKSYVEKSDFGPPFWIDPPFLTN